MTYPTKGGRYVRDAETGELTPAGRTETPAADAPAPQAAEPAKAEAPANRKGK